MKNQKIIEPFNDGFRVAEEQGLHRPALNPFRPRRQTGEVVERAARLGAHEALAAVGCAGDAPVGPHAGAGVVDVERIVVAHADGRRLAKRDLAPTLVAMRDSGADGPALATDLLTGKLPLGFAFLDA